MVLDSAIEILVPLFVSIIFSAMYEMDKREMLWAGIIAMAAWLISGFVFLVVSSYPVISLIFMAIGLIYLIRIMIDLFAPLRDGRKLGDD